MSNLLEDGFCCLVLALLEIAVGLGLRSKGIEQSATDHLYNHSAQEFCCRIKNQNFYPKMQDKIWNREFGLETVRSTKLFKVLATLGSSEPSSVW